MVSKEVIAKQLQDLGYFQTIGKKAEINYLPEILANDESILGVCSTMMDNDTWLCVITPYRLLFLNKGILSGLKQIDFPINQIKGIAHKTGLLFGEILLDIGGQVRKMGTLEKGETVKLASVISHALRQQNAAGVPITSASVSKAPQMTNIKSGSPVKTVLKVVLAVFIVAVLLAILTPNGDKTNAPAENSIVTEFNNNRTDILASVQALYANKQYKEAVDAAAKYLSVQDEELTLLHNKTKTEWLLEELKFIPVEQYSLNLGKYKELLAMHPDNEQYQSKVAFYTEKVEKFKKIEAQFSGWNGSHTNLVNYIKNNMNDPKSFKHIETRYWVFDDHLVVITEFYGKNAFNATIKSYIKAKVSLDGQILQIME